ncbi:MAG TPA: 2Fe-2S iron-sulfur cluster-binding protein [Chthoniobacterales bacterium]|jgi:xanthine dehydrogenase YagT iron-sulfur-binding subunit
MSDELDPHSSPPGDSLDEILIFGGVETRRKFLKKVAGTSAALTFGPGLMSLSNLHAANVAAAPNPSATMVNVQLKINGAVHKLHLDPRVTLLDLLRENLLLTGSKKGCDHGQCGACTVLVNGRRANACLLLAVTLEGDEITTIEGLAQGGKLHPMQAAFVAHDGFQCGYCTPGQICSAVACVQEGHAKDDAQIREFMSGNLCRCGAYPNIVDAIKEARGQMAGGAS